MKSFLIMCFTLAAVFNAPVPCAHAMGVEGGQQKESVEIAAMSMGDDPMLHAHHDDMSKSSDASDHEQHEDHNGCAEDCLGGAGCEGCASVAASLDARSSFSGFGFASVKHLPLIESIDASLTGIDPPPPRA